MIHERLKLKGLTVKIFSNPVKSAKNSRSWTTKRLKHSIAYVQSHTCTC
jgi:hypothetical protein